MSQLHTCDKTGASHMLHLQVSHLKIPIHHILSHVDCFATLYLLHYFWIHFGQIQQLFHTVKAPRLLSMLYYRLAHLLAENVNMREGEPTIATLYSCEGLPQITCSACEECLPFLHLNMMS